jgi:hypothetical protein
MISHSTQLLMDEVSWLTVPAATRSNPSVTTPIQLSRLANKLERLAPTSVPLQRPQPAKSDAYVQD